MKYRYYACDVFTEERFGGNPLAVFPDADEGLTDDLLQKIATEMNYSETTFCFPHQRHTRQVRIFTPTTEVPFAGHPNVGTAFVLASAEQLGDIPNQGVRTISFAEKAGVVPITIQRSDNGRFTCELQAPQPLTTGVNLSVEQVAETLTLLPTDIDVTVHTPLVASVGLPFLMVRVKDVQTLGRIKLNLPAFEETTRQANTAYIHVYTLQQAGSNHSHDLDGGDDGELTTINTTTRTNQAQCQPHHCAIRARMFAPMDNVPEDPATGSANAALAALLTSLTSTTATNDGGAEGRWSSSDSKAEEYTWTIQQGVEMGRPSTIFARTNKHGSTVTGVWVKGSCVMVCEGWMEVNGSDAVSNGDGDKAVDEYLERVFGSKDFQYTESAHHDGIMRRLSRGISNEFERRRRSSIREQLPQTTYGWTVLLSTLSALVLRYELRLQKSLTCPPHVYGQVVQPDGPLQQIYQEMTKSDSSILKRNIQPSLFVGTRGALASIAAYALGGPQNSQHHVRFRERSTIPLDGTEIAVEWELPTITADDALSDKERQEQILKGPIRQPVVLVLHGLNNHADFGYVRSMMRTCVSRGWVAAGMNFRGCGGVPLKTPRGYNGAYTGDIRYVVQSIVGRLDEESCIFLIGNSLGANLITKYLGEEGLSGSLPQQVAGGVALGNPLVMNSGRVSLMWSPLMALGAKKTMLENWPSLKQSNDPNLKKAVKNALLAFTLKDFDEALAPVFARNSRHYPFNILFGFDNADAYGNDAASYKVVRHVPVPLLTLAAKDDMIVYQPSRTRLAYCLANPNVMWVETMCGGHLGWQESPPEKGNWGFAASWADSAAADFIEATLKARHRDQRLKPGTINSQDMFADTIHIKEREGFAEYPLLQSKL